jgi:hypothetical protein
MVHTNADVGAYDEMVVQDAQLMRERAIQAAARLSSGCHLSLPARQLRHEYHLLVAVRDAENALDEIVRAMDDPPVYLLQLHIALLAALSRLSAIADKALCRRVRPGAKLAPAKNVKNAPKRGPKRTWHIGVAE